MAKRRKRGKPLDPFILHIYTLNRAFGRLTFYESWDDVPSTRRLPAAARYKQCPECMEPFSINTWPRCGFCGFREVA